MSEWAKGYDAGNNGLIAAVNTAKMLGAIEERKRIIKVLENPLHHNIRFPDEHINCYTCELIALIKGENK